ncbi:MAG: hypothetical protein AAFY91_07285 [Bacteroidota bacterium]
MPLRLTKALYLLPHFMVLAFPSCQTPTEHNLSSPIDCLIVDFINHATFPDQPYKIEMTEWWGMTDSTVAINIWWVPDILIARENEYLSAKINGQTILRTIVSLAENKQLSISDALKSGLDWDGYNTQSHPPGDSINWPPFDPPTIQATYLIPEDCFSRITCTERAMEDKLNSCLMCN